MPLSLPGPRKSPLRVAAGSPSFAAIGRAPADVQAWSNIHISPDQLVQFAEGVTVLPSAQVGHG
jgi:hypothetical protein